MSQKRRGSPNMLRAKKVDLRPAGYMGDIGKEEFGGLKLG